MHKQIPQNRIIQSILWLFCFIKVAAEFPRILLHMKPKVRQIWRFLICVTWYDFNQNWNSRQCVLWQPCDCDVTNSCEIRQKFKHGSNWIPLCIFTNDKINNKAHCTNDAFTHTLSGPQWSILSHGLCHINQFRGFS